MVEVIIAVIAVLVWGIWVLVLLTGIANRLTDLVVLLERQEVKNDIEAEVRRELATQREDASRREDE